MNAGERIYVCSCSSICVRIDRIGLSEADGLKIICVEHRIYCHCDACAAGADSRCRSKGVYRSGSVVQWRIPGARNTIS